MKKETIRYSEGFKRQRVKEFEEGECPSVEQARKAYQIKGFRTIQCRIGQYGNTSIQPRSRFLNNAEQSIPSREVAQCYAAYL
jgi:hypothetical protein